MKDFYENEADEVIRKACEAAKEAEAEETAAEPETDDGACAAEPETGAEETAAEPESEAEAAAKAAAAAAAAEEAAEKKEDGKKEKKDPKDQQIEDLKDQVRRNLAEFDNYRKRTDREKAAMFDMGAKNVLEKLLPVIDNFERGLDNVPDDPEADPSRRRPIAFQSRGRKLNLPDNACDKGRSRPAQDPPNPESAGYGRSPDA